MAKRIVLILVTIICGLSMLTTAATASSSSQAIPTIFFHGWASSFRAEQYMTDALVKAGITRPQDIIIANVSASGEVTFSHQLPVDTKNPVIEVNYQNNRNPNYYQDGGWAKNVIVALTQRYHFKKVNLVGHSLGNMDIMYYLLTSSKDTNLPSLNKQVAIAGNFNGILRVNTIDNQSRLNHQGRPLGQQFPAYRELKKLRQVYPRSARVLNIYGDLQDGSYSDGRVAVNSARSLRYLVSARAKSYQEKEFTGPLAEHSRLHHNDEVNQAIINFLYKK